MIIMEQGATDSQIKRVVKEIKKYGLRAEISRGAFRTVVGLVGDETKADFERLATLPGVKETKMVETPYKLISREFNKASAGEANKVVKVGKVEFGGNAPVYISGPCAIESKAQLFKIAEGVKKAGAHVLRGGVFKPRSSAHSWQGLGGEGGDLAEDALAWLREAGDKFDMPVVTEVRGESQVDLIAQYVDIIQIGARNMYNYELLKELGRQSKPVLLKRGMSATIDELLQAAEYILLEGNLQVILCERGIRTFENRTRNTLDLSAVAVIKSLTSLPVLVDPSHAVGKRDLIAPMSRAAIACGADGLIIESHCTPDKSVSDAAQAIEPSTLAAIVRDTNVIYSALNPNAASNNATANTGAKTDGVSAAMHCTNSPSRTLAGAAGS